MSWQIFYSYAHEDDELRKKLITFLGPLRQQKRITEWHDRQIEPGALWDKEIRSELSQANLILFLLSSEFLDSDYCFGVEVETALDRMKRGEARVVPVLMKPCLWEDSRFSALQIVPRDAKPICSTDDPRSASLELFHEVAKEIRDIVTGDPPQPIAPVAEHPEAHTFDSSLELVRNQVRSYAHNYERTRQRMKASNARTARMEQIMGSMQSLATASYPLLRELVASPSPGERLAAVAILQVFASESLLPFLVGLVKTEKPFVCFHALTALRFAVNSLDPTSYDALTQAINEAKAALQQAHPAQVGPGTDRARMLADAEKELDANIKAIAAPTRTFD
jgi:hypothetical protein